jgi:hypothetical protein
MGVNPGAAAGLILVAIRLFMRLLQLLGILMVGFFLSTKNSLTRAIDAGD